jgi:type I restriction enzyme, S subunit
VDEDFVFVSESKADALRNANTFPGDIVITHRGTLGQVGLIPKSSQYPRYVVSQSQMLLSVDPNVATPQYVYRYLCSQAGQHALLANTSQTGVPAIARPTTSVRAICLIVPPLEIQASFDRLIGPMVDRQVQATQESSTLAALRDALLPKLLSGVVRVRDAERLAHEAMV